MQEGVDCGTTLRKIGDKQELVYELAVDLFGQ